MHKSIPFREKLGVFLGNFFEHYDTALFGFLSPVLAPIFFPKKEALEALILTSAIIPIGMLARPLGALFFGFISDELGRRTSLFFTLLGMSFTSIFIALIPINFNAPFFSAALFAIARLMQNFFASAEVIGGGVFLVENSENEKKDLISSLYSMSTIAGILFASFAIVTLSKFTNLEKTWRYLYFLGAVTGIFGLMLRRKGEVRKRDKGLEISLIKMIQFNYKRVIQIAIVSGFSYANFSISMFLAASFFPLVAKVTKLEMMQMNTYLLFLDLIALPFFGVIAKKIGRDRAMVLAASLVFAIVLPFVFIKNLSLYQAYFFRVTFVLLGVLFTAPFHSWANELIPKKIRCQLIGLSYAIGSQLLGGPTISLSLWVFKKTGLIISVFWYWLLLSALSIFAILVTRKTKGEVQTLRHSC
jgi:MHS family proline/betaine transporter-like MFS transporter